MIDWAMRGQTKPVGVSNPEAVLHRPRGYEDAEAVERGKAARSVIQMALGRHNCAKLPACPEHGKAVCECVPCLDPRHVEDLQRAREALQAFGLAEMAPAADLTCSTCHKVKPRSCYSKSNQTCRACLSEKKAVREAKQAVTS
jgi:hypothetical protein